MLGFIDGIDVGTIVGIKVGRSVGETVGYKPKKINI